MGKDNNYNSNSSPACNLTFREKEVLKYIVLGLKDKEISIKLKVSINTIKQHVKHIYEKLRVNNRIKAAIIGVKEFRM